MAGRVYGGLTADERHARRRRRLLDAALEVFAARGWHGAKVADVCAAAGVSPRSFYAHFAGREELFLATTDRIAEDVERVVRDAVAAPAPTPDDRSRAVLVALAGFFEADPRTAQVALVESFATPALRAHRAELLGSFSALAARLMRALHPEPERADRRALELSGRILAGGMAEALVAGAAGARPAGGGELVEHLVRLYRAAASAA